MSTQQIEASPLPSGASSDPLFMWAEITVFLGSFIEAPAFEDASSAENYNQQSKC
jgi:hypothetical protein